MDQLKSMSQDKQTQRITAIKNMLVHVQNKIKEAYPNVDWQYEPFFSHFFKDFIQGMTNASEQQVTVTQSNGLIPIAGEIVNDTQSNGSIHSTQNNDKTLKK